jgi:hypothetical protein
MSACPDPVRLVAASSGEDVAALAHAAGCPACRRAMRDHLALRDLARGLSAPALERGRCDGMSAELLARAEDLVIAQPLPPAVIVEPWQRTRRAVAAVAVAAGALAAAAAALTFLDPAPPRTDLAVVAATPSPEIGPATTVVHLTVPPEPPPALRPRPATVTAGRSARYDRRDDGATDRIALREGTVTIEASAATAPVVVSGKNVRVRTGKARLAAHAEGGIVRQVQVFAGSVEIQTGSAIVVVTAGETWSWDDPAAAARVAAFRTGWDALRARDFTTAATELDKARDDRGVGEDATYWAAIAWGRAGEPARARAGLERFLDRFPRATRAGEAHLALARLLGAGDAARAHLQAAAADPDPRVRAAAEAALTE